MFLSLHGLKPSLRRAMGSNVRAPGRMGRLLAVALPGFAATAAADGPSTAMATLSYTSAATSTWPSLVATRGCNSSLAARPRSAGTSAEQATFPLASRRFTSDLARPSGSSHFRSVGLPARRRCTKTSTHTRPAGLSKERINPCSSVEQQAVVARARTKCSYSAHRHAVIRSPRISFHALAA